MDGDERRSGATAVCGGNAGDGATASGDAAPAPVIQAGDPEDAEEVPVGTESLAKAADDEPAAEPDASGRCAANGSAPHQSVADGSAADAAVPDGAAQDASAPDGVAQDASAPDGVAQDAPEPDGVPLAGVAPDASAPDGVPPGGSAQDASSPDGVPPAGVAPADAAPDGFAQDASDPDGVSPDGSAQGDSLPDGVATDEDGAPSADDSESAAQRTAPPRRRPYLRRVLLALTAAGFVALAVGAFSWAAPSPEAADRRFVEAVRSQGHVLAPGGQETLVVSAARKICDRRVIHNTDQERRATALTTNEIAAVGTAFGADTRDFTTLALETYCPS